jgi:hypothetical protein
LRLPRIRAQTLRARATCVALLRFYLNLLIDIGILCNGGCNAGCNTLRECCSGGVNLLKSLNMGVR